MYTLAVILSRQQVPIGQFTLLTTTGVKPVMIYSTCLSLIELAEKTWSVQSLKCFQHKKIFYICYWFPRRASESAWCPFLHCQCSHAESKHLCWDCVLTARDLLIVSCCMSFRWPPWCGSSAGWSRGRSGQPGQQEGLLPHGILQKGADHVYYMYP